MSRDLKDARWQLAEEMATGDGFDFSKLGFFMKNGFLEAAQNYLAGGASRDEITELARRFREDA